MFLDISVITLSHNLFTAKFGDKGHKKPLDLLLEIHHYQKTPSYFPILHGH